MLEQPITSFSLIEQVRAGGANKIRRPYWEFCIGGEAVFSKLVLQRDLASVLWIDPPVPSEIDKAILRLMRQTSADFPDDRVALYGCPECGDLGCGALTAKVDIGDQHVLWHDFGYENTYEEDVYRAPFKEIGPFRFDRVEYEGKLEGLLSLHKTA